MWISSLTLYYQYLTFQAGVSFQEGISLLGDIQKPSGHCPGQPAQGIPTWAGGWTRWPPEIPSNLNHSVILWSYANIEASVLKGEEYLRYDYFSFLLIIQCYESVDWGHCASRHLSSWIHLSETDFSCRRHYIENGGSSGGWTGLHQEGEKRLLHWSTSQSSVAVIYILTTRMTHGPVQKIFTEQPTSRWWCGQKGEPCETEIRVTEFHLHGDLVPLCSMQIFFFSLKII